MAELDPRESAQELVYATECRCDPAWTERGLHHPNECFAEYRPEIITLAAAAGVAHLLTIPPR